MIAIPPSSPKRTDDSCGHSLVLLNIKILKYYYVTHKKEPFKQPESLEVSPTHLTPTPELDPCFNNDDDQYHCLALIPNLDSFPIKSSEELLNQNFCQFKKCVNDNNLLQ